VGSFSIKSICLKLPTKPKPETPKIQSQQSVGLFCHPSEAWDLFRIRR